MSDMIPYLLMMGLAYIYLLNRRNKNNTLTLQEHIYYISCFSALSITCIIDFIYQGNELYKTRTSLAMALVIVFNVSLRIFKKDYPKLKAFLDKEL